jgi:hypothetical protein
VDFAAKGGKSKNCLILVAPAYTRLYPKTLSSPTSLLPTFSALSETIDFEGPSCLATFSAISLKPALRKA